MNHDPEIRKGIQHIGRLVAQYRHEQKLSQQKLAERLGHRDRNIITQLEQGRRLPSADDLTLLGQVLDLPHAQWRVLSHPGYVQAIDFEDALSELLGKPLSFQNLDPISQYMLIQAVGIFIQRKGRRMSTQQAHDHFNALLTFYGERPVSQAFYSHFLGQTHFESVAHFSSRVQAFQKDAIRIYGSFRKAFKTLSVCSESEIAHELLPLQKIDASLYTQRLPFNSIQLIPEEHLDDLGYIAVERVRKENQERHKLSNQLLDLASWYEEDRHRTLDKRKRDHLQTLLRRFGSDLEIDNHLFHAADPAEIRREAQRLAPADHELIRIDQTQQQAQQNLAAYLTEPYMDLYIATSMRARADFISVDAFVRRIFSDPQIASLKLRYFNPTQSWIADRVAKGLVEALMLRRASLTVYMAQKDDTFGKDSEASVALGQGKPVIVYVPRLSVPEAGIRSDELMGPQSSEHDIKNRLQALGQTPDPDLDHQGLAKELLKAQLKRLSESEFHALIITHWADFDLYGELKEIDLSLRTSGAAYLDALTKTNQTPPQHLDPELREALTARLVETAIFFERRAKTFKEIHPLALQVILSTGVLNGILVVRSAEDCTRMIYQLLTNELQTELHIEADNYRLIETHTGSTLRVISKHKLLTNAFWTQYFS